MAIETVYHGGIALQASSELQLLSDMSQYAVVSNINSYISTIDFGSVVGTNYLTTAAVSDHTHSNLYQSTGAYLTTAMVSNASSTLAGTGTTVGATNGTLLKVTLNSAGLNISIPAYITTYAAGGGDNRSFIEIMQGERLTRAFNLSASQLSNRPLFVPFWLDGDGLAASTVRMLVSFVTNTLPPVMTYGAAIYTTNNITQLGLLCSTTATMNYASSQSASFSGVRVLDITGMTNPIPSGRVVLAVLFSGAATGSINFSIYGGDGMAPYVGFLSGASDTVTTADTLQFLPWWGRYSANSGSFPSTVNKTQIYGGRSADLLDLYAVIKQI